MKKLSLFVAAILSLAAAVASADVIRLNDIDTNDCVRARQEVRLLRTRDVRVRAECSPYAYRGYPSNNGRYYDYRLYTSVEIPYNTYPGEQIQLNDIDTNNCSWARNEISILNLRNQVRVTAVCSPYSYQGYRSDNGRYYNYRLYTTMTILR